MPLLRFRAWNGHEMISPDYIDRDGVAWWEENSIRQHAEGQRLMQSTGLKDCQGKEIFEGDIVEATRRKNDGSPIRDKVTWNERGHWSPLSWGDSCGCCFCGPEPNECVVIGNIYETPDLLPS